MTRAAQAFTPRSHSVSFFDHEVDLVADVGRFAADGLRAGERVILFATAAHRDAIDQVLLERGVRTAAPQFESLYRAFDAREMLSKFVVGSTFDSAVFLSIVGDLLDEASADRRGVRVFGEMVALLWDDGDVTGAMHLESLWNYLARDRHFALLCGYPAGALVDCTLQDTHQVCQLHSTVTPPRSYSDDTSNAVRRPSAAIQASGVFLPGPAAVSAARRFVEEVLDAWGEDHLAWDAALVTSELATNVVEHVASPFRIRIHRMEGLVRIAVEDLASARPELRSAPAEDTGGRGIAIVDRLAQMWGCAAGNDGKVIFADLATRPL
jgi:anti-sigma regulatory factor (Ser/Thr protein kinase)